MGNELSLFEKVIHLDNLYHAFYLARKGKRYRTDVVAFSFNLEPNLASLHQRLKNEQYTPAGYRQFYIYESKPRVISVAPFIDRVVHHAIMNYVSPILERHLSPHCFACRKGKGVHKAVNYYQSQSRRYAYVLKMNVKKYFPSINHAILKHQLATYIHCEQTLNVMNQIINGYGEGKGLPIGNLTSQLLANLHLTQLDHFFDQQRGVAYLRYVDDMFLLGNDKQLLWQYHHKVTQYVNKLNISLRPECSQLYLTREKVDVLGYKVTPHKRWLRNENGYRFQRKLQKLARQYAMSDIDLADAKASIASWVGHAKQGQSNGLAQRLLETCIFVRNGKKGDF
jgi:retron-type reverse transcriptase